MIDSRFSGNPRVELYARLKEHYQTDKEALKFFASLSTKDAENLENALRKYIAQCETDWTNFVRDQETGVL